MKECTTCNNAKNYKDMCPECRADSESLLNDLLRGNGDNKYCIVVKCKSEVYDQEWAYMLMAFNIWLKEHDNGKFSNVGAYLEAVQRHA